MNDNRFGCVRVNWLWLHLLRRSFQYFRDQFPARWIDNELKWRVMTWSTNSSERPKRNITWRRFFFWVFQRSWCFTSWRVILVYCLTTEQETDRGNTELIYVVDEVRVNVPLHIRIYSVDLNTAPRDDHFCPASFRTRENLTVYKSGDKSSKSKRWRL